MTRPDWAMCRTITIRDRSSISFFPDSDFHSCGGCCFSCFLSCLLLGYLAGELLLKIFFSSLFSCLLDEGCSNAVHVGGSFLGQGLSNGDGASIVSLEFHLSEDSGVKELVEAVADVFTSSHLGDLLSCSTAGLATEVLAESLDTDLLSHVELVANGGSAHVEPVVVERVQLLVESCLDGHGPLLNIILIKTSANKLKQNKK